MTISTQSYIKIKVIRVPLMKQLKICPQCDSPVANGRPLMIYRMYNMDTIIYHYFIDNTFTQFFRILYKPPVS